MRENTSPTPYLQAYYETHDEDARLRSRAGQVEYLTTMRYIDKYLKPGMRILEIGAATGRYSHALARMGYRVDAVELLEHNIRIFRENTQPGENITITQGNATDLSAFPEDTYDMMLLLGPMYHLFTQEEQRRALHEALRVTKPGGLLLTAYCNNEATIYNFCFMRGYMMDPHFYPLIDKETFKCSSNPEDRFVLHRPEEIDALMADLPAERLHLIGTDMMTQYIKDTIEGMSEEMYQYYLRYHFLICERPDMTGITNHYLDICRKRPG
ncbi:MAG: methyltransferase domain-containing protein [Clostridia bacterium]|nr:methyltransferase domain-containing protein [Clostridia bacterium]